MDKHCHEFHGITRRFSYLRRFSPALLQALTFEGQDQETLSEVLKAIDTHRTMNTENRRSLPEDAPTEFIPQKLQRFVQDNGTINREAWECVLLLSVRDELKSGNLAVAKSEAVRAISSDSSSRTVSGRENARNSSNGLDCLALQLTSTYADRSSQPAYDAFLQSQSDNSYATVDENGTAHRQGRLTWQEKLGEGDMTLFSHDTGISSTLRNWLAGRVRTIRLPQPLIEVDNELNCTRHFMNPARRELRRTDDV